MGEIQWKPLARADAVPSAGKLLDATHVYQYVFLLAGAEVVTSSFVLVLGNFFCIGRRPKAAAEEEEHHKPPPDADVRVDSREVEHFLKAEPALVASSGLRGWEPGQRPLGPPQ